MWYVEARFVDKCERWEGLTLEQSKAVYSKYRDEGCGHVRSGRMNMET